MSCAGSEWNRHIDACAACRFQLDPANHHDVDGMVANGCDEGRALRDAELRRLRASLGLPLYRRGGQNQPPEPGVSL